MSWSVRRHRTEGRHRRGAAHRPIPSAHWDAAHYLAGTRLPKRVSQTWLAPQPGTYPLGVALRLTGPVAVTTQWIGEHRTTGTPAHLRVRVDRLIWQACDQQSWQHIGQAWFDAQRYLTTG